MRVRKIEGSLADTAASRIREPFLYGQVEDAPIEGANLVEDANIR